MEGGYTADLQSRRVSVGMDVWKQDLKYGLALGTGLAQDEIFKVKLLLN